MSDTDRLLTRAEVEARCAIARTTIYRLMRCGQFPEPLKLDHAQCDGQLPRSTPGWPNARARPANPRMHKQTPAGGAGV